jgi:hypothetical protein
VKTAAQNLVDGKRLMDFWVLGCEADGRLWWVGEERSFWDVLVRCGSRVREVIMQVEVGLVTGIAEVPVDYCIE